MMEKFIDIIVGARPNFIKVAAIIHEIESRSNVLNYRLIHTSQHYDDKMSGVFFEELNIPSPHINLNVGKVEASKQVATIIERYCKVLEEKKPQMVIVSGDVNSTLACALATKKSDPSIPLVHVEAGLRCGDRQMPEEINRILTDSISDFFFTTSRKASDNLVNEGVNPDKIFFVGNTMIDTLYNNEKRFSKPAIWKLLGLQSKSYFVLTLHRQANISNEFVIRNLLDSISEAAENFPIIFPMHPHTAKMINNFGIKIPENIFVIDPLGYLEFNFLVKNASAVITDSGGISEETTIMNVPCMTLRANTERPETCDLGTNMLLGNKSENIFNAFERLKSGNWQLGKSPEFWDGFAASRIVDKVYELIIYPQVPLRSVVTSKTKSFGDIVHKTFFLN